MILAIDAGNTRIKWGVHDGANWSQNGVVTCEEVASLEECWRSLEHVDRAVVASVAAATVNVALDRLLQELGMPSCRVGVSRQASGVKNGYEDPAKLGVDRWAAMIAAWQAKHAACVVVSAGTAMTVDALSSQGEFLGGLIVPGLAMMKSALMRDTASVGLQPGDRQDFPACTGDAVHSGVVYAMTGAVRHMVDRLAAREGSIPALILSGGDAAVLQQALLGEGEIMDNLVLEGLLVMAKEVCV